MQDTHSKGSWWAVALDIFARVSAWIVVPLLGALALGKWMDAHFGTRPWLFLACTGIGFAISSFGIVRALSNYLRTLEKEAKQSVNENRNPPRGN